MGFVDILIVVLYLVGMFAFGFWSRTQVKSVDDFLVAGNRFKTFSLVGTIMASMLGAGGVLGNVGNAFQYGSGILWYYIGMAGGMAIFGLIYAGPLRKANKRTMAEIIGGQFGRMPRFVASILAAVYALAILAIGITGLSRMLVYISGSALSSNLATIIAMAVSIGLTALGGLYSVVWTDTIQFVIMVIMILVVAPIVVLSKASFSELNAAAAAVGGTLTNPAQNVPVSYIILTLLTVACSIPGDPTIPQRALAGDTVKTVKRSFYYSTIGIVLMGVAMTLVGLGALTLMPNLAETHGTQEAAFPIFIINYFPPVLKGLGISALMAAVVSTVTSMLLVGTTHLVYDAGQVLFPNVSDHTFKRIMPAAIVILGAFITWISLSVESIVKILYVVNSLTGAALVLPLLFALYWKKLSKWGVTLGMLFGAIFVVVAFFAGWDAPGGDPVYLGMALSLIGLIGGSLLLPDKKPHSLSTAE